MMNHFNIWSPINDPRLGFTDHISEMIKKYEKNNTITLPNLRNTKDLFVFSDFSGQHKESKYEAYSFLLCDLTSSLNFLETRKYLRKSHLKNRRISFKSLNDKIRLEILSKFLNASSDINGLLITILIDKKVGNFFSKEEIDYLIKIYPEFDVWKKKTFEKLLRIIHFSGLFIAGLSCPHQNIYWFTDEDDILVNTEKHFKMTELFGFISGLYFKDQMGHFKLGSTKNDSGIMDIEDFCSLPDLTAGALCELLNYYKSENLKLSSIMSYKLPDSLSYKTKKIINWLSDESSQEPLKKHCLIIESVNEKRDYRFLNFFGKNELLLEY